MSEQPHTDRQELIDRVILPGVKYVLDASPLATENLLLYLRLHSMMWALKRSPQAATDVRAAADLMRSELDRVITEWSQG